MRFVPDEAQLRIWTSFRRWWSETRQTKGVLSSAVVLTRELWGFLLDSTPERRRQRYGDMDYDWGHRVNTTSGTIRWKERLLGIFHSPYQATEESLFREIMASLPVNFSEFTFIDLGSGKGRTLLMASEYPFRRIIGVEVVPELHRAALANIAAYKSETQACKRIDAVCADARAFSFPPDPLVLYLFNPLPEAGLREVINKLGQSLKENPRTAWVIYGNALLETVLAEAGFLQRVSGTEQYVVYQNHASQGSP